MPIPPSRSWTPQRQSSSIEDILQKTDLIFDHRVRMNHPRFFGFIPSPESDIAWLGDVLNSAYNTHAGSWFQSSGPNSVEQSLLSWMAEDVIGFPGTAGGVFVSGGSMANLTALVVARDQKLSFHERPDATTYVSEQTHSSIVKALRIIGFDGWQIRKVSCDAQFRMDVRALQSAIDHDRTSGKKPFLLVATAGTTNTGSVDPLADLAAVPEQEGIWLHVDGADRASCALSAKHRSFLTGIERCDSLTWEAHK